MVHGIVQQNGGWIEVQSKLGQGTTFRIYSPQTEVELTNGAKPATPDSLRGEGTVLIVEDQHAVRRLTRKMLQARGYIILEAANGEKAHAVAKQHAGPIDLLLTDVVMPGTDGLTLSGQLQRLRPNLRVILMSGYSAG
jgi:two-component system cell cycle sensor histidine kinase/response regulator CckA